MVSSTRSPSSALNFTFCSNGIKMSLQPLIPYLKNLSKAYCLSQPHFEASVRMRLALPKVGTWSPPKLPKLQSSIAGVKTPCLEVLFIPLERS